MCEQEIARIARACSTLVMSAFRSTRDTFSQHRPPGLAAMDTMLSLHAVLGHSSPILLSFLSSPVVNSELAQECWYALSASGRVWKWVTSTISTLRKLRQGDCCGFENSLSYKVNSRRTTLGVCMRVREHKLSAPCVSKHTGCPCC